MATVAGTTLTAEQFWEWAARPENRDKHWELEAGDAEELSGLADAVVAMARQFAPERCRSASECVLLTRDARESVQLMIANLRRPDLLDTAWVSPWRVAAPLGRIQSAPETSAE